MGCKATTKAGKPCRSTSVHENGYCTAHQPQDFKDSIGLGGAQKNPGPKVKPRLIDVLRQEVEERMQEVTAPFWDNLTSDNPKIAMEAAKELLDRSYGKPKQATEISGPEGEPIELVKLPTDKDWEGAVAKVLKQSGALDADSDQDQ